MLRNYINYSIDSILFSDIDAAQIKQQRGFKTCFFIVCIFLIIEKKEKGKQLGRKN